MTLKRLLLLTALHLSMQKCFPQTNVSGNKTGIERISQNNSYGFIENKGQIQDQNHKPNTSVKYLLNTNGLNVQLKANSFSYDTYIAIGDYDSRKTIGTKYKNGAGNGLIETGIKKDLLFKFHRIDISLEGSNTAPIITTENQSRDFLNFYTSLTSSYGAMDVHHYSKITYHDIYPGIDMVFDASRENPGKQVEYYFIVKPGADASKILLHYNGALETELKNNAIEIKMAAGKLLEQIPASYIVPGSSFDINKKYNKIDVRYKKYGNNIYGFSIPSYNKNQTLIIDPTPDLEWGTYYGQSFNDWGYAIAKDQNGNLFIAGATNNASGIATAGAYQSTFGGAYADAILGKFNINGVLQWMTYFGGSSQDEAYGVATDGNNVIITGWTFSTNAIATPGSHQEIKAGPVDNADAFIAKFSNNGIRQWSTYFGGDDEEFSAAAATDSDGNIFITGYTISQNGISTPGSQQQVYAGGNPAYGESGDGFIAKFNNNGVVQWGTYYGGGRGDRCYGIAIDEIGNVLVAGSSNSSDHIASTIAYQGSLSGPVDGFIVKLSNDGVRRWGTYYGGNNGEEAFAVATDGNNNIFITGRTYSTNGIATPGTQQPVFGGNYTDVFIAKFNPDGTRQWGTYYGGNGIEIGSAITTDQSGNVFITGSSHSTNNITTPDAYQTSISGNVLEWTPFIAKFNSIGFLQWGTYYGNGPPGDPNLPFSNGEGEGIITDASGNVFVCGSTTFRNGVSTCGAQQTTCGGYRDIFVARFTETNFSLQPSVSITADTTGTFCQGLSVTFKATAVNTGTNYVYQWKLNGVNVGTNSNVFVSSTLVNGDIVNCVVSMLQTPCNPAGTIASNNIVVAASSLVTPSVTITGSASTICKNNKVVFTATALNGGTNPVYQWKINGENTGTNNSTYTTTDLRNGDVVTCKLTSSLNCITTSTVVSNLISITVNDIILPRITLQVSSDNVCPGTPVTFNVSHGNITGIPLYEWKLNGNNIGSNSITYSSNNFSNGDLIHCVLTTVIPGCSDPVSISSDTTVMKIKKAPVIILQPSDTTISYGGSLQLTALVTGVIDHFTWNPQSGLSNPSILNPVVTPAGTTTYQLHVVNTDECEANEKITISILTDIFIPTAFTPNGDGKNDIFRIPPGSSFTLRAMSIYDRWGNVIFETRNINEGWNGRYKGIKSPNGSYVYLIEGRTDKGAVLLKGTILLVR